MVTITKIAGVLVEMLLACRHARQMWPRSYGGKVKQRCLDCGQLCDCKVPLARKVA